MMTYEESQKQNEMQAKRGRAKQQLQSTNN